MTIFSKLPWHSGLISEPERFFTPCSPKKKVNSMGRPEGVMQMKWLLVIALLFCAFPFPSHSAEDQAIFTPTDPAIQEFVRLVNAKRRSMGFAELKWDSRVAAIARDHSADMVSRHFFSHTNPDKKGPSERLQESNLVYSSAAENLARHAKTARQALDAWLRSPGHRRNILDKRFTQHGVGRVGDRWTHVLISP
jgi:uncharacterized protein YkwD